MCATMLWYLATSRHVAHSRCACAPHPSHAPQFQTDGPSINAVHWHDASGALIGLDRAYTVRLWDSRSPGQASVAAAQCSAAGGVAAVGHGNPGGIKEAHQPGILAGSVGCGGNLLAVAVDNQVQFIDVRKPTQPDGASAALVGAYTDTHAERVSSLQWHPDMPGVLMSGDEDGVVNVWNTAVGEEADALSGSMAVGNAIDKLGCCGPSHAVLWALDRFGGLALLNLGTAEMIGHWPALPMHWTTSGILEFGQTVTCVTNATDASLALVATSSTGKLYQFSVQPSGVTHAASWPAVHKEQVRAFAAHPGRAVAYSGAEDGKLAMWALAEAPGSSGAAAHSGRQSRHAHSSRAARRAQARPY